MSHRSSPGLWPMSASAPRGRATAPRRAERCGEPAMPPRLTAATAVTAATTATVLPPRREVAPTVEALERLVTLFRERQGEERGRFAATFASFDTPKVMRRFVRALESGVGDRA